MPWGEHRGKALRDVPIGYLLSLYRQRWIKEWHGLYAYLLSRKAELESSENEPRMESRGTFETFDDFQKDFRGF